MITLEECVTQCGLTQDELDAVCEHEHLPEVAAVALAEYLLRHRSGETQIAGMIRDDMRQALDAGDRTHAATLLVTLRKFLAAHPA